MAGGLAALWALPPPITIRPPGVRGPHPQPQFWGSFSSCSMVFLLAFFLWGVGKGTGEGRGLRKGFLTQQVLLYYVNIFQGLFFN